MPKLREPWDSVKLNAQIDRAHNSLRQELWAAAQRPNNLTDSYIQRLLERVEWNRKWTFGTNLHNPWRQETI